MVEKLGKDTGSAVKVKRRRIYARKDDIVLAAAEQAFLKSGYGATSMDAIAELAGVSKRTVYSNFANKETLFAAVIRKCCGEAIPDPTTSDHVNDPPEQVLLEWGKAFLQAIYNPDQIALFQTIVADSRHFPEVGKIMYEGPVTRSQAVLDAYIRGQVKLGRMRFAKPEMAAAHFEALLKTNIHVQLLFSQKVALSKRKIDEIVKASVDIFLYGSLTGDAGVMTIAEQPRQKKDRPAK